MQILSKPCGDYRTNCYLLVRGEQAVAIDPGDGAYEWIKSQNLSVQAVLNTHGHFDHVANNAEVAEAYGCAVFAPAEDIFMLAAPEHFRPSDALATPVARGGCVSVPGFGDFIFHHCPGHTPGCSVIEHAGVYFSGDFVFANTIGRCDFAYSSPVDMLRSLAALPGWMQPEFAVLPGHGARSTGAKILMQLPEWLSWF